MHKGVKRILAGALTMSVVLSSLTGCKLMRGASEVKVDEEIENKAAQIGAEGVTLNLMACTDWIHEAEFELAEEFEIYTGIHVEFTVETPEAYQDKIIEKLSLDEAPDIFLLQSGFALDSTYQVQDRAVDLSDESWVDQYSDFSKEMCSVDGKLYGMTYFDTTTDYDLLYNKKLLKAAGVDRVPETFEEFDAMCQKLLDSGVIPIYEPTSDGWHQTLMWADMGQVFEKRNPGIIDKLNTNQVRFQDDPDMLMAMTQLNSLAEKGYFGDNFMTDAYADAESYMASGEYAMCMLKAGSISAIVENNLNVGYKEEDFGLMLLPLCDNTYLNVHPTGPTRFISNKSPNIEAAKLYFEFLASKNSVQYMIDHDSQTENMPFNVEQEPCYTRICREFSSRYDEEHSGVVLQDTVVYFNEQWGDISMDIAKMYAGEMTPKEVLEAVDIRRAKLARESKDENW